MVLEPVHYSLLNNEQRRVLLKYILIYFINWVAWEVKEEESYWKHYLLNKAFCERAYGRWDLIDGRLEEQKDLKEQNSGAAKRIGERCLGSHGTTCEDGLLRCKRPWHPLFTVPCFILGPAIGKLLLKHTLIDYSSIVNYQLNWLLAFWFIQETSIEYLLHHHH